VLCVAYSKESCAVPHFVLCVAYSKESCAVPHFVLCAAYSKESCAVPHFVLCAAYSKEGRAVPHSDLLTTKARVHCQRNLCVICGRQSGNGTNFFPSNSVSPCQCHSTTDRHIFIHLSPTFVTLATDDSK